MNIVVGNPRSGTSLAMDCLVLSLGKHMIVGDKYPDAGKVNHALFNTGEAIDAAKAIALEGQHIANPFGFWESPMHVMGGVTDSRFLNHWVKVIFGGLQRSTPECLGKVIMTMRNPAESAASSNGSLDDWYIRTRGSLLWAQSVGLDYLVVDYKDMIDDPDGQLVRISEYTGLTINQHRVTPELYRNREKLANHIATDLYLAIIDGSFDIADFPAIVRGTRSRRPQGQKLKPNVISKMRGTERVMICQACEFRSADLCSKNDKRVLGQIQGRCPEDKWI